MKGRGGASVATLRPGVAKLGKLLPAHLAYEENVLAAIGYDELEQHKAEHGQMLKNFTEMQARFDAVSDDQRSASGSLMAPGWPVMQFFLEFTFGHVGTSDMRYCQAMKAGR